MPLPPRIDETIPVSRADLAAFRRREPLTLVFCHRDGTTIAAVPEGGAVVVGRSAPADVVVPDDTLSRRHARVSLDEGDILVEDLGSRNGTFVNGARIEGAQRVSPSDQVMVGACALVLTRRPATTVDGSGFLPHDVFMGLVTFEATRARHFQRPFAFGRVTTLDGGPVARLASDLARALRPVDRVAAFSDDALELLLPESDAGAARAVLTKVLDVATAVGVKACAVVAPFPLAATTADALVARARQASARASADRALVALGEDVTAEVAPSSEERASGMIVKSAAMRALAATIAQVAPTPVPVLIHGETGTGKELVARAVHEQSDRRRGPIVCVNCGAIAAALLESTLFGHEKGAFTGADKERRGVFEQAQGGTVFLDEVGELPLAAQAALLRVLEAKTLVRVGGTKEITLDVRVVAATHRDLEAMCAEGQFREDLLFRLNVMSLSLPALRARKEEVPLLAEHFVKETCRAMKRPLLSIDAAALDALAAYAWPGNIRELRNAVERAAVIARDGRITVDELPERVRHLAAPAAPAASSPSPSNVRALPALPSPLTGDLRARLHEVERALILEALAENAGVQTRAAVALGLPLRTLVHKLKALGIKRASAGYVVDAAG